MTPEQLNQRIYNILNRQLQECIRNEIEMTAKLAAEVEGKRVWDSHQEYGGGRPPTSPYNPERWIKLEERAHTLRLEMEQIVDHAVKVFLNGEIPK